MHLKLHELDAMLGMGMAVYEHYYPIATGHNLKGFNQKMFSPFRDEKNPSFTIFPHRTQQKIFFKDHGIDKIGSHWQFVMDLYGLDFKDAVKKVKSDILGITDEDFNPNIVKIIRKAYRVAPKVDTKVEIFIGPRDYNNTDIDFFASAGISPITLQSFHASALSYFDLKKEGRTIRILEKESDPMYSFSMAGGHRHKIYRPKSLNPRFKWTSNLIADDDVFGLDLIPKQCKHLFLLGGNRDTMSFTENIGLPAIALASETTTLTESLYSFIRHTAENIWVMYDNDDAGYKKAKMFNEMFGLPYLNGLYDDFGVNDFVEMYQNGMLKEFKSTLLNKIE